MGNRPAIPLKVLIVSRRKRTVTRIFLLVFVIEEGEWIEFFPGFFVCST